MREKFQGSKQPIVEIEFAELQDGSLVDVIQDPVDPSKSRLAVYNNGVVHLMDEVRDGKRILVPIPRSEPSHKHVRLPRGAEPFISVNQLFLDICSLLSRCIDLEPYLLGPMAIFGISTWFPEKTTAAPYLSLIGLPGSGKTTAMRALSLVCRRSLLTSDLTSAGFYDVCEHMRPTVFIDETLTAGHRPTIFHLLRSSNTSGFVSLRKNKAQLAYGPKVLAWLELPNDPALTSRCIFIPMRRTAREDLMSPSDAQILLAAEKIQMCLLRFRLEYFKQFNPPKIVGDEKLFARELDLYRALALPIGSDEALCKMLAHSIVSQRQFHRYLLSAPKEAMLRVLAGLIHAKPSDCGYLLADLTRSMNLDLLAHNEPAGLNERQAGNILTSLGLTNRTRKNAGYFLWLYRVDRQQIHHHLWDNELHYVPSPSGPKCEFCPHEAPAAIRPDMVTGPVVEQAGSSRPKHERRPRCGRRPHGGIRLPGDSQKQSRPRKN